MIKFLKQYKALALIISILISTTLSYALENDGSRYTRNSVLSTGNWYKVKTPKTGVYKLTYKDLKDMGIANPKNVQIYGYGGAMLDEDFSKPYLDDLPQVSIWMSNTRDNFGEKDYILFFAQGSIKFDYNETKEEFERTQNPYSFDAYYFVTESTDGAKIMNQTNSLAQYENTISTFDDYFLHEQELVNIGKTGRVFYGENFNSQRIRDFDLPLTGIVAGTNKIHYNFVSKAPISVGKLDISLNNKNIESQLVNISDDYYEFARELDKTIETNELKESNTLNLTYTRGSTADINVHLNYILVSYKRRLQPYGAITLFRSATKSDALRYQVSNASNSLLIFDITDNFDTKQIGTSLSGATLTFAANNSRIREYAMVDISKDIPKPSIVGKIKNQNLHSLDVADMTIIVQPELQKYAEELAQLHKEDSGLTTLIVNPEDIYNEFSSGNPDVTAYRRFMKMFYDRATNEDDKPKYLLLLGGGTYNNRFIGNTFTDSEKKLMLLTYQSEFSLRETASYVTDDYMGFLDDKGGVNLDFDILDLGVGRIPARTETEAADAVQKIKQYINNSEIGIWENNITFVADDAVAVNNSVTLEKRHMAESELLANFVNNNYPSFIVNKIYEDNFERLPAGSNNNALYPTATEALLNKINEGTLVLNYVGHGSTRAWAHENLLTSRDIETMTNSKLPLWITATCDFSRFDDDRYSGGQTALFNPNGGAIALFSTVRVVFASNNKVMNDNIIKHIFEKSDDKPARLGDILRNAKSESNMIGDLNKLKFLLLGDPALRLSYPGDSYKIDLTDINGLDPLIDPINLQALSEVKIKGNILDKAGNVATDFNGAVETVVFDVEQTLETRGNTATGTNENVAQEYTDYTNKLFSGRAEVRNGEFEIIFTVPKDILDIAGNGKMSFLAYNSTMDKQAQGSYTDYTVRGSDPNAIPENNPPVISKMYLDDESFVPGGIVGTTPVFVAYVSDDTGINLSNDGSHNISLLLDGKTEFNLTPYFENDGNNSKSGVVKYPLPFLPNGKHTITFTVWDVWNNSTVETFDFIVTSGEIKTIDSFEIWGNPAREKAIFVFNTEYPSDDVNIKIQVYSLNGQMVWNHDERSAASGLNQYIYEWNLTGNGGGRLVPGIYVCNTYITIDNRTIKMSKKIIIAN